MTMTVRGQSFKPELLTGTTLSTHSAYYGDGEGATGCYYWDEVSGITSTLVDALSQVEVQVDATADVTELAAQFMRDKVMSYIPSVVESFNDTRAGTITKGDKVKVVRGRKVAKGVVGKVFWKGQTKFGVSVGIALSDRRDASGKWADVAFTSPSNLEVVAPPTVSLTDAQVEFVCDKCARIGVWDRLYENVRHMVNELLGEILDGSE